jgi:spermidine/putrescine transport system permease protein
VTALALQKTSGARRLAQLMTVFAFLLLYFPLLIMIVYSFIDPTPNAQPIWTLRWYRMALSNEVTLDALKVSLIVGISSTLAATFLGTLGALAMTRAKFRGKGAFSVLVYIPLVMPEIVMGLSLLIWFVRLGIPLGVVCVILGHITFSLSYVLITVRARLEDFDPSVEEAARDLGATAWQTFQKVTLPLISPAILSGALIAFTLSFDDFLVTFFTAGVGSDTLPVRIYSMIKFGMSPEIHALSSLMLGATLVLVLCFFRPGSAAAASR